MKKIIILFMSAIILLFFYNFFTFHQQEQFVHLAYSFSQGKFYFLYPPPHWGDTTYYGGKHYWPLGPFPAVLLMPFVYIFGIHMQQGYLAFFLNILNAYLLFRIANKIYKDSFFSLTISFAILFATAYLGIALTSQSWYYAHVVNFTLTLLALEAFFYQRSWLLIGLYIGFAIATRITSVGTIVFFTICLLSSSANTHEKFKKILMLLMPIILSVMALGFYNYARFANFFETGYSEQLISGEILSNRSYGTWNFIHFPANLYYLFLKMPDPVFIPGTKVLQFPFLNAGVWGMSILFTSPVFIWIFFSHWKRIEVKAAFITTLTILFLILGYSGIGAWQYGYRFAVDLYPFLFIILVYALRKKVTFMFLLVVILSFIINSYLIITAFRDPFKFF